MHPAELSRPAGILIGFHVFITAGNSRQALLGVSRVETLQPSQLS